MSWKIQILYFPKDFTWINPRKNFFICLLYHSLVNTFLSYVEALVHIKYNQYLTWTAIQWAPLQVLKVANNSKRTLRSWFRTKITPIKSSMDCWARLNPYSCFTKTEAMNTTTKSSNNMRKWTTARKTYTNLEANFKATYLFSWLQ